MHEKQNVVATCSRHPEFRESKALETDDRKVITGFPIRYHAAPIPWDL